MNTRHPPISSQIAGQNGKSLISFALYSPYRKTVLEKLNEIKDLALGFNNIINIINNNNSFN